MKQNNIRRIVIFSSVASAVLVTGCAGTAPKAHVYSPFEKQQMRGSLGMSSAQLGATGEAKYCIHGLPSQAAAQKQQALANIANACGGEDKYSIIEEQKASVRFHAAMGVETACDLGNGRVIYFKCSGKK